MKLLNRIRKHGSTAFGLFVIVCLIAIAFLIGGCSASQVHEDRLYITRKYVGDFQTFETMRVGRLFKHTVTRINTGRAEFYLIGDPQIDIPTGARCYVKYFPESLPNSASSVAVLYFTWNGTYDMYEVWQDRYTGKVY